MILRRIADAIRIQNWFTVTIEFTLVVAGVLVALQLDNWNNERQTRLEEQRLAEQLLVELDTAIHLKNEWFLQTEAKRTALGDAIMVIQSPDPDLSLTDEQCLAAWSSHLIFFGVSHIATLEEILAGGSIRALNNKALREALLVFHAGRKRTEEGLAFIRDDFANLIDIYPEAFPRTLTEASPSTVVDITIRAGGALPINTQVDCQLDTIRASQAVRNKLISNLARTTGVLTAAQSEIAFMQNLKSRLTVREQ